MDFARDDQLDKKTLALKKHAEWRSSHEGPGGFGYSLYSRSRRALS